MEFFNVNWVEGRKSTPVENVDLNQNGKRIFKNPHPDEELFLSCASERICQLARMHQDSQFILTYKTGIPQKYFWVAKKNGTKYSPILKLDDANRLIPVKASDDEFFTLDQVSELICKMARAYPNDNFEIIKESPLMADVSWIR